MSVLSTLFMELYIPICLYSYVSNVYSVGVSSLVAFFSFHASMRCCCVVALYLKYIPIIIKHNAIIHYNND